MDGVKAQEKVYYGYAKSAAKLGLPYTIYRSVDGDNPIQPANSLGDILMSPTASWNYMKPKKYGDATWILIVDGREIEKGDYLVGESTFFLAGKEPLMPLVGVMCDREITIKRPKSPPGVGDVGYSAHENNDPATYDILMTSCPAAFLKSSRGQTNKVDLPTDAKMPWYAVFVPIFGSIFLRTGDIITDNDEQQYIISDNEHTELGWHLNVHGLEA